MTKTEIEQKLKTKRDRLASYYAREKEMLNGGVQSYGVGTRNLARYNTDLNTIKASIKELEDEITTLERMLEGNKPRKAISVIPRDW